MVETSKLSPKQELFCIEYAKTGNGGEAYVKAGYKAKDDNSANSGASRLLTKANIQSRLQEIHNEVMNESIASIQEIKEFWTAVMRNEKVEQVIVGPEHRPFTMNKDCYVKDRLKASEFLGRTAGLFLDRVQIDGNVPVKFVDDLDG